MSESYLFFGILIAFLATFTTRAIPFLLFSKKRPNATLRYIELYLPIMIMIVLVFYAIKDVSFITYPYGIAEIIGILVATSLHLIFKKALFSIITSTIIYMLIIQNYL